jgi:diamine N-acetyltransferase
MTPEKVGGCSCGAVRYTLGAVARASFCHCRACQRASGAPLVAWAEAGDVAVVGEVTACDDGEHGVRSFCPRCGTTILRRAGDRASVAVCTLDDPDAVAPTLHLNVASQRRWLRTWDGLARVEGGQVPDPAPTGWRAVRDPSVTAGSAVSLRSIDDANRIAVASLAVSGPQQRFVAPNALSLMQQAFAAGETWLRAVYADEVPVGLVLIDFPTADERGLALTGRPYLWRFMIDDAYQGLGFGRKALLLAIEAMRARGADVMYLSYVPGRGSPGPFYERLGFCETGVALDGEVVLSLAC